MAYLLGGLGGGFAEGMERGLLKQRREEEEKKNMVLQLLQGVAEGKVPPQMFATPEMQDFLEYSGVSGEAPIKRLLGSAQAQAEARPPKQMTSPTGAAFQLPQSKYRSMEEVGQQEAEKARQAEMAQFYGAELPKHIERERATKEVAKAYEKTPSQKVQEAIEFFQTAEASGMPVESMTFNGIDYQTAIERKKLYMSQAEKQQVNIEQYRAKLSTHADYRAQAVKFLSGIKSGEQPMAQPGFNLAVFERAERMPAEARIKLLTAETNRTIREHNKELRQLAIGAKVPGAEIEQIEEIDPAIFEVEEEPGETPVSETRSGVGLGVAGKGKGEPSEDDVTALAKELVAARDFLAQQSGQPTKPLTIDEARKIAREELKKKK